MICRLTLVLSLFAVSAQAALADVPQRPAAYQELLDCRAERNEAARLGCYDRAIAGFAAATESAEVLVLDKAEVERQRRARFGSSTHTASVSVPILAGTGGEELDRLDSKVAALTYDPSGKLRLELENGAVWQQIDSRELGHDPRIGMAVTIRRAALGTYLVNIAGQTAIRMRRER